VGTFEVSEARKKSETLVCSDLLCLWFPDHVQEWDDKTRPSQSTAIAEDDLGRGCWAAVAGIVVAGLTNIQILEYEIEA
jgi:hypothetical protein